MNPTAGTRGVNPNAGVSRREFLARAAALGLPLLFWQRIPGLWRETPPSSQPAAERLAGLLSQRQSARVVGAAYLEAAPSEARVGSLVDAIAASLEGGASALRVEERELRGLLANRVERDFKEDAIVCLRGWILSRTEARLCGLAALA